MKSERAESRWWVCGGCGCWCDDIPEGSGNGNWGPACDKGIAWFESDLAAGQPTCHHPDTTTVDQLAQRLSSAHQPALFGLTELDIDAQRAALAVADQFRAIVDPCLSATARAKTLAMQQVGQVTATWSELHQRADVVVYWNCDPKSAPRFRSRYGDRRTTPERNPKVVVAWNDPTAPVAWEDPVISLNATPGDVLQILEGHSPGPPQWQSLAETIANGRYVAWVVGDLGQSLTEAQLLWERMTRWAIEQNRNRRMVVVPWAGGPANAAGIQSVMAWRTGYPMAVSFANGVPEYQIPGNFWQEVVKRQASDFILWVGAIPADAHRLIQPYLKNWIANQQWCQIASRPDVPEGWFLSDGFTNRKPDAPTETRADPPHRKMVQRPDGVMVPSPWTMTRTASILDQLVQARS